MVEKGPELAGFLYDRLVSETADAWFGRRIGAFFSGLEIPFPGNGDRTRQRLGSNGELLRRKPEHLVLAGHFRCFVDLGLPSIPPFLSIPGATEKGSNGATASRAQASHGRPCFVWSPRLSPTSRVANGTQRFPVLSTSGDVKSAVG